MTPATTFRCARLVAAAALIFPGSAHAAEEPVYGPELEEFTYPAPVRQFNFSSQGAKLHMAYMDIAPQGKANGRTVVLLYDMIHTQPVVYEFPLLTMPTLLLIGLKDTAAIGKDAAPEALRPKLGNYPELAAKTARAIPKATLLSFPEMGHAPQMQDPAAFHAALLKGLGAAAQKKQ